MQEKCRAIDSTVMRTDMKMQHHKALNDDSKPGSKFSLNFPNLNKGKCTNGKYPVRKAETYPDGFSWDLRLKRISPQSLYPRSDPHVRLTRPSTLSRTQSSNIPR